MDIALHPSKAETASGNSASFGQGQMGVIGLYVKVTAMSGGAPLTIIVKVQDSPNNVDFYDVPNLVTASISAVGQVAIRLSTMTPLGDYVRLVWTITGTTPSITFQADLEAYDIT